MRLELLIFFCLQIFVWQSVDAQRRGDSVGTVYNIANLPGHDPVMIKEKNTYYIFCTGFGVSVFSSADMKTWRKENPVFAEPPAWAVEKISGFRGHTWAPDIQFVNGKYYLYYSVSVFGKNTSCIGLAVNKTLDKNSPDFIWEDKGLVIQSVPGRDDWNAIDPNLIVDENNTGWLSFGSFWSGIKLFKTDSSFAKPAEPLQLHSIASAVDRPVGNENPIEAPFIFHHGDFYYLFVSRDYCCKGENSTYKVIVGRSKEITGPYVDDKDSLLTNGGGKLVLSGDAKRWFAAGHNGIFKDDDGTINLVAHGYDRNDKGRSRIILRKMGWDNKGWPFLSNE